MAGSGEGRERGHPTHTYPDIQVASAATGPQRPSVWGLPSLRLLLAFCSFFKMVPPDPFRLVKYVDEKVSNARFQPFLNHMCAHSY